MATDIYTSANGRWQDILMHFGVDASYLSGEPGPCPLCKAGEDRFSFDDKNGEGTFVCRGCPPARAGKKAFAGRGMDLLMRFKGWDWTQALTEVRAYLGIPAAERRSATGKARVPVHQRIWDQACRPVPNGVVHWWLLRRGLGSVRADWWREELREAGHLAYYENKEVCGHYPAMVARLLGPTGNAHSAQVTYLTPEGTKAPVRNVRKTMPKSAPLDGVAVRLGTVGDDGRLGLAEGIETALSAAHLFSMPVWACLNTTFLTKWVPPEDVSVRRLVLFGDHDANYAGHAAVFGLAHRLSGKNGLEVEDVRFPSQKGWDWNDVLRDLQARRGSGNMASGGAAA